MRICRDCGELVDEDDDACYCGCTRFDIVKGN